MTKIFELDPGSWWKDPGVQSLTHEEKGIWFEMLLLMVESEEQGRLVLNEQPTPRDALANSLRTTEENLNTIIDKLLIRRVASITQEGVIYNRRLVREAMKSKPETSRKGDPLHYILARAFRKKSPVMGVEKVRMTMNAYLVDGKTEEEIITAIDDMEVNTPIWKLFGGDNGTKTAAAVGRGFEKRGEAGQYKEIHTELFATD